MSDDSLALLSLKTVALICPVCLEQLEPDEDSDGRHFHYGTSVEPIEVETYPYLVDLRSKRDLALFRLQTDIRDHAFRVGEERWYGNLSVKDRFWEDQRRIRVRREELERKWAGFPKGQRGLASVMAETMQEVWGTDFMRRQLYGSFILGPREPRADDLDIWLAEGPPIKEVEAALL